MDETLAIAGLFGVDTLPVHKLSLYVGMKTFLKTVKWLPSQYFPWTEEDR
jgi:hypothetical protein